MSGLDLRTLITSGGELWLWLEDREVPELAAMRSSSGCRPPRSMRQASVSTLSGRCRFTPTPGLGSAWGRSRRPLLCVEPVDVVAQSGPDRADVQWSPDHSPGNLFGVIGAQPVAVAVPRQTRVRSELGDRARDASPKVVHSNVAPSGRRPDGLFTTAASRSLPATSRIPA
jgi:hypothetical protein